MHNADPIKLQGVPGSPYTKKLLAVLRYRNLPYRFIINTPLGTDAPGNGDGRSRLPLPKVPLMPTVYLNDAAGAIEAVVDTTPIIRRLENLEAERRVIPDNSVIAFLNYVLEDYADEWLTRCMYHYRWTSAPDIKKAGSVVPLYFRVDQSRASHEAQAADFTRRQVGRLGVVGSSEKTAPIIEASYVRFLKLFEKHLECYPFLLGKRPSSSDFAVMGQLTCLTHFDPTPMRLCEDLAPRVYAWVERVEDLSGYEASAEDWLNASDPLPPTLEALLSEVARTHMLQLIANARAVVDKCEAFRTEIDGCLWEQKAFPYQLKCFHWTLEEFQSLSSTDKVLARSILERTGLLPLIEEETATV